MVWSRRPIPTQHRVRGCNSTHLKERRSPRENLSRVSGLIGTRQTGAPPYLPGRGPESIHITGHCGVYGVSRLWQLSRLSQFQCVATRKLVGAGPTVRCPICGVRKDGRVAEAGDPGGTIFVNQDVFLGRKVYVNRVTRACGMKEGAPSGCFRGRSPGHARGSSIELFSSAVIETDQRVVG